MTMNILRQGPATGILFFNCAGDAVRGVGFNVTDLAYTGGQSSTPVRPPVLLILGLQCLNQKRCIGSAGHIEKTGRYK